MRQRMFIDQLFRRRQDHPLGANLWTGIGKVIISMHHIHILIVGCQYQCHGYLPMLIWIHAHHGKGMIQGHITHHIPNHLIMVIQLQEGQRLMDNYITKAVSPKRNRLGFHRRRRRWSIRSTKWKEMEGRILFQIQIQVTKSQLRKCWLQRARKQNE